MANEPQYVVMRHPHGVGLAVLVEYKGDVAIVKRLKGQMYRIRRPQTFKPIQIPKADVLRDATRREMALGHADLTVGPELRAVTR